MKKTIVGTMLVFAVGISACNNQKDPKVETKKSEIVEAKTTEPLNNLISIIEISVSDFSRAVKFYQTVLGVSIQEMEVDGVQMGILPNEEGTVNVVLAKGTDYKPTTDGAVLYLNAGNDLQSMLDKIEQNGGQVIVPKTQISPEMGFFALFIDSEGNKLGLHSLN